ncbi:MAG: hypothetical protein ACM3O4_01125 [Ignavibacteriales bacterium]
MKELLKCKVMWGLLIFMVSFAYVGASSVEKIEENTKEANEVIISMNIK